MSLKITTTKNQVKRVGMYPPTTIEDHKVAKWKRKYSNFIDSGSASPIYDSLYGYSSDQVV